MNNLTQKCKALYFDCNVQKPSVESLDHQRSSLFKYFFAFCVRGLYPHVFSNNQTLFFLLSDPYKVCHKIFVNIIEKLEPIALMQGFATTTLLVFVTGERGFLYRLQLEKDNYSRLFALWKDGIFAVKDKDLMWCTAVGG